MSRMMSMLVAMATAVAVTACGDNVIGPSNQPEIANAIDNFQFQASNLDEVSQVLTYTWPNTGTQANIDQSGAVSGGTATLVIRDASNAEVYSRNLRDTGSFVSGTGSTGNWRIEVRLNDVSGTLNFRVQKRP